MITEDEVMRLLERADPARDRAAAATVDAAGYLDALRTRSTTVTLIDTVPAPTVPKTRHRWLTAAAAAAVVAIVVGALLVVARDDGRSELQIPAGPPAPTGDLIVWLWSHPRATRGDNVHVRVYADGRFLRARQTAASNAPDAPWLSTGWMEQRLTPEGVELLRSEINSGGLFDPDQPVPNSVAANPLGIIEVVNGDTPVEVHCCWPTVNVEWRTEFERLLDLLREPESWLPPSAWEDLESTAYVPSWYEVCLSSVDMAVQPIAPSPLLTVLPAAAQDPLNGARHWTEAGLFGNPGEGPQKRFISHCFDLDADNARRFTGALHHAGIEPDEGGDLYRVEANSVVGTVDIFVSPYLPHGEADCGCSG